MYFLLFEQDEDRETGESSMQPVVRLSFIAPTQLPSVRKFLEETQVFLPPSPPPSSLPSPLSTLPPRHRRHRCRSDFAPRPPRSTPCRLASSSGSSCEHNGARIHLGQPYHPPTSATLLFLRISVEQRRGIIPFSCASTILLSIYFPPFFLPWVALSRRSQQPWIASRFLFPSLPPPALRFCLTPLPFLVFLFLLSPSRSFFALAFVSSTANLLRHL